MKRSRQYFRAKPADMILVSEVARRLNVKVDRIYRGILSGEIKGHRLGGHYVVPMSECFDLVPKPRNLKARDTVKNLPFRRISQGEPLLKRLVGIGVDLRTTLA